MTQQTYDGNDALMGGGTGLTALKFGEPGDRKLVTVLDKPTARQEHEYDPITKKQGKAKFFPSGDPIMGVVVTVQTNLRDPQVEDDDGKRSFFIEGKRLKHAVRDAVLRAGARGLEPGGALDIELTHYDTPGDRRSGRNWRVVYTPPQPGNDALMGDAPPQAMQRQPQPYDQDDPWARAEETRREQTAGAAAAPGNVGAAAGQLDPQALADFERWQRERAQQG